MNAANGSNVWVKQSAEAQQISNKLSAQTPSEIVDDYLKLPTLPYGQTIRIDKIACLNYDPVTEQTASLLTYKLFRLKCAEEFPECKYPDRDYTDDDYVSPVIIVSGETKYRVKMSLWFPLCDAFSQILTKQMQLKKKLLPITVLIDDRDAFMVKLMNLGLTGLTGPN